MASILVVEDDRTFSKILQSFLLKNGFEVSACFDGKEGVSKAAEKKFQLILLDYRLPDATGMEVLESIRSQSPETPVIIMTSFSDLRTAVRAIKAGAYEYITKPVNPDELLLLIRQALQPAIPKKRLKESSPDPDDFVKGSSPESKQLQEHIHLVAPTEMTILIQGESGTGKEHVARSIHQLSKRAKHPFVAVDCGALSKELAASELFGHRKGAFTGAVQDKIGQFDEAEGGTLFLDEVGNLSYEVQMKLLRALQERVVQPVGSNKIFRIDVRIIAATNDDLLENIKKGLFREDLYYRLNEFKLYVPPVRSRMEDLDEFMDFFRMKANHELNRNVAGVTDEVKNLFRRYDWPGNLREMKNVIKRAVLISKNDRISLEDLPHEMAEALQRPSSEIHSGHMRDLKAVNEKHERELIARTLQEVKFNKSKAARLLNIDRKTLYLKMEKYKIDG
jgi:two-component system, NtrC family, response regulator HydG